MLAHHMGEDALVMAVASTSGIVSVALLVVRARIDGVIGGLRRRKRS